MSVVGIDPGARFVGIVTVDRGELVSVAILDRRRVCPTEPLEGWARFVLNAVTAELVLLDDPETVVAVEGVKAPNPHVRRRDGNALTNPTGIIETAAVFGAIVGAFPRAVVVEPGGNGAEVDLAYPSSIRSGARLGGPSDHVRAAYDVARKAPMVAAIRNADRRVAAARA